eukprot:gene1764-33178_t
MPSSASPMQLGVYECLVRGMKYAVQMDCQLHLKSRDSDETADAVAAHAWNYAMDVFDKVQDFNSSPDDADAWIGAMIDKTGLTSHFEQNPDDVTAMGYPSADAATAHAWNYAMEVFDNVKDFNSSSGNPSSNSISAVDDNDDLFRPVSSRKLLMAQANHEALQMDVDTDMDVYGGSDELIELALEAEMEDDDIEEELANGLTRHVNKEHIKVPSSYLHRRNAKLFLITPQGCKYKFRLDDPENELPTPDIAASLHGLLDDPDNELLTPLDDPENELLTPESVVTSHSIVIIAGAFIALAALGVGMALFIGFSHNYSELMVDKQELNYLKAEILKHPHLAKKLLPEEVQAAPTRVGEEATQAQTSSATD